MKIKALGGCYSLGVLFIYDIPHISDLQKIKVKTKGKSESKHIKTKMIIEIERVSSMIDQHYYNILKCITIIKLLKPIERVPSMIDQHENWESSKIQFEEKPKLREFFAMFLISLSDTSQHAKIQI